MRHDLTTVRRAAHVAATFHHGQMDRDGRPHFHHVARVAAGVRHLGPTARVAALLHDTVEDTALTLAYIRATFGREVAEAVDAVTRREGEVYARFVERAARHPLGRAVKIADARDNLARCEAEGNESLARRYRRALAVLQG